VGAHCRRAFHAGNLSVVRALAHELPEVPPADTLAIVLLLARREPHNYPRAAAQYAGKIVPTETDRTAPTDPTISGASG
jgi:hypothetical protein